MDYFKLLCWIFCVWDVLILIAIIFGVIIIKKLLHEIENINRRHIIEIHAQRRIVTLLKIIAHGRKSNGILTKKL